MLSGSSENTERIDLLWKEGALGHTPDASMERIARTAARLFGTSRARIRLRNGSDLCTVADVPEARTPVRIPIAQAPLARRIIEQDQTVVASSCANAGFEQSWQSIAIEWGDAGPVGLIEVAGAEPLEGEKDGDWGTSAKELLCDMSAFVATELDRRYEAIQHTQVENHLRKVAANMRDGLYRSTPEAGIVYANEAFVNVLGYDSLSQIKALTPDALYADPDEREQLLKVEQERGGLNRFVVDLKRRDGTIFTARISSTVEWDTEGEIQYFDGVVADITEQQRIEQALKRQQQLFRTLVENAQPVVFAIDADGTFLLSEGSDLSVLGLQPGEVVGQSVFDLYADRPDVLSGVNQALSGSNVRNLIHIEDAVFEIWYSPIRNEQDDVVGLVGMAANATDKYEAEQALQRSAERWERLVESHPDPILVSVKGGIKYVNPAGVELLEAPNASAIVDMPLVHFIADKTVHTDVEARIQRVYESGYTTEPHEHVICGLNGKRRIIEARSVPITYNGMQAAQTIVRDITKRREAERELQKERDLLERVFNTSAAAITILGTDGQIREANSRAEEVLGLSKSDLHRRTYNDPDWQIEGADGGAFPEEQLPFEQVRRTHQPVYDVQHAIVWPDGRRRVLSINGAPLLDEQGLFAGAVFTVSDITKQRKQAQTLREMQRMLDAIVQTAGVGICVIDSSGRYVRVNPKYTEIFGWSDEELVGTRFTRMVNEDEVDAALAAHNRVIAGIDTPTSEQWNIQRKDGTTRDVLATAGRVELKSETYNVTTITDITDRVQAEQALKRAKHEAEAAARLKSAMLANMSHEVRTPLTSIIGFSEVLEEETKGETARFASHVSQSAQRLLTTLDSVLRLSKLEADRREMDMESVDFGALVHDIAHERVPYATSKDVQVSVRCRPDVVRVVGDEGALQRIAYNLICNAIKFTDSGGTVQVDVVKGAQAVMLEVTDTGVGMEADFQKRMFKAFTQESEGIARVYEGSGLGLAIVKKLVDLLGGSIEVESTRGYGTRIAVFLPPLEHGLPDESE